MVHGLQIHTYIGSMYDVNIIKYNFVCFIVGRSLRNYGSTKVINAECSWSGAIN